MQNRQNRIIHRRRWSGFFLEPGKNDYNPDQIYDPSHNCVFWKECCAKNINLMPTILRKMEEERGNIFNSKKRQFLETEMSKVKAVIEDNIKDKYEKLHNIERIMAAMKTYTWYCNELLRIN